MALSPDEPERPSGPPKYLPRIKYEPPTEEPPVDEETEAELEDENAPIELDDGTAPATPKPKFKPNPTPKAADATNPVRPGSAPKPKPKGETPAIDRGSTPPRSIRKEPAPKATPLPRISKGDHDEAHKGVLVEATPEAETYEGRRRIRTIIGAVAVAIIGVAGVMLWKTIAPSQTGAQDDLDGPVVITPPRNDPPRKSAEALQKEADALLAEARTLEKAGRADEALARVERVLAEYAETASAKLASAARERHKQGLPLFVDGVAVIASKKEKPVEKTDEAEAEAEPEPKTIAKPEAPSPFTKGRSVVMVDPTKPPTAAPAASTPANMRPLPAGFRVKPGSSIDESGWPQSIVSDRDGSTMMLIPGGVFIQGRDDGRLEERPSHRVQLSPFYIDQHEVTNQQFALFKPGASPGDRKPAVSVSLSDAKSFAQWAGKSLPTESQWEMAARATDARIHPWGNAPADFGKPRAVKQIDPVMSFASDLSPYGVFDLAGNAAEWTSDWFDPKYYLSLKGREVSNPAGPPRAGGRLPEVVIKGGSKDWDASWRSGMRPEARLPYLGFRCVLNLDGGPNPGSAPNTGPSNTPDRRNSRPGNGAVPF